MGILIDASIFIECERRQLDLTRYIAHKADRPLFISVVTASELLHGVHRASKPEIRNRRQAFVESVIDRFPIKPIDLAVARIHARIWAELAAAGTIIDAHDRWLAATCLAHGLSIATLNVRHFSRMPDLSIEVWSPVA